MTSSEPGDTTLDMDTLAACAAAVTARFGQITPRCTAILGSGWGDVTDAAGILGSIPYDALPGLGATKVKGHAGTLHLCRAGNGHALVFQGRRHWYEGQGWTPIAVPVYLAARLGSGTVLLTNAAGAITAGMQPGDLMIVRDHINLLGANPLIGSHHPFWGERFPDQSAVYPAALQDLLSACAARHGVTAHRGVYLAATGPVYETPAEIRAYRALGADAVGMSTVPEAILANAAGLRVAALSCITNYAAGVCADTLRHDDVLAVSKARMPVMAAIVREVLQRVCDSPPETVQGGAAE